MTEEEKKMILPKQGDIYKTWMSDDTLHCVGSIKSDRDTLYVFWRPIKIFKSNHYDHTEREYFVVTEHEFLLEIRKVYKRTFRIEN